MKNITEKSDCNKYTQIKNYTPPPSDIVFNDGNYDEKSLKIKIKKTWLSPEGLGITANLPKLYEKLLFISGEGKKEFLKNSQPFIISLKYRDNKVLCNGKMSKGKKTLEIRDISPEFYNFVILNVVENPILWITNNTHQGFFLDIRIIDKNPTIKRKVPRKKREPAKVISKKVTIARKYESSGPYLPEKDSVVGVRNRNTGVLTRPSDFGGKKVDIDRGFM